MSRVAMTIDNTSLPYAITFINLIDPDCICLYMSETGNVS